jgi:hypothetical protein
MTMKPLSSRFLKERLAKVERVAEAQQMVLWNIAALARLMEGVEEIHEGDFPDDIAAGLRMIKDMTTAIEMVSEAVL